MCTFKVWWLALFPHMLQTRTDNVYVHARSYVHVYLNWFTLVALMSIWSYCTGFSIMDGPIPDLYVGIWTEAWLLCSLSPALIVIENLSPALFSITSATWPCVTSLSGFGSPVCVGEVTPYERCCNNIVLSHTIVRNTCHQSVPLLQIIHTTLHILC